MKITSYLNLLFLFLSVSIFAVGPGGPDQTICRNSSTDMGATGTGYWSVPSGNPASVSISNFTDPTTHASGFLYAGLYVLTWTTGTTVDTVLITATPPSNVSVSVSGANYPCAFAPDTFRATPVNGGSSPAYQWYINSQPVSGATLAQFVTGLASNSTVSVMLTSSQTCVINNPAGGSTSITLGYEPSAPLLATTGHGCLGTDTLSIVGLPLETPGTIWYRGSTPVFYDTLVAPTTAAGNGTIGTALNQVISPSALCFDTAGYMYVIDESNYRVVKFPPGTTSLTNGVIVAGGNGRGTAFNQFFNPYSIFVDRHNVIYVADNERVLKFPAGSTSATFGSVAAGNNGTGDSTYQINSPQGVFVDSVGNLYVSDRDKSRVLKFPPGSNSTTHGQIVAGYTNGVGTNTADGLYAPGGITMDRAGYLYVADAGNNRIQKFPPNSVAHTAATTIIGNVNTYNFVTASAPADLAIDSAGYIYICNQTEHSVRRFPPYTAADTQGVMVAGIYGQGNGDYQLDNPYGVKLDAAGNVYVADYNNHRIQKNPQKRDLRHYVPTAPGSYSVAYQSDPFLYQCANSDGATAVTVNAAGAPSVTVSSSLTYICAGVSDTFRAVPTLGGTFPAYQWYRNGATVGTSSATYISNTLSGGDSVWVSLTSNNPCASPNTALSNKIHLTSNAFTPSVTITANQATLCSGSADTFHAVPVNGGASPIYEWYKNSVLISSGSTTLTTSALVNNDTIQFKLTNNLGCTTVNTATSNKIIVTVVAYTNPSVSITATNLTMHAGSKDTFSAAPVNGGSTPSYQWYKNGVITGSNSANYIATSLNNGDSVWVVMTSNALCTSPATASSNHLVIIVTALPDSVWPGDADHNGIVDNNDLLPIGLGYDTAGPVRSVLGIAWQGDAATDWTDTFGGYSPVVNFKHADCNGDGLINATDTLAVTQNYSLTHAKTNGPAPWRSGTPVLMPVNSSDTLHSGDILTVSFMLGNAALPVNNFYGLAFTYNFDPASYDSSFTTFSYGNSWIGNNDKISIKKIHGSFGQIQTAVTRIDHTVRSGNGAIATASFKIGQQHTGTQVSSNVGYISDVKAIDASGHVIQLNEGADTSHVAEDPTGIAEEGNETIILLPNPANDRININAGSLIEEVHITNMIGQVVSYRKHVNKKAEVINISDLSTGVYMVHVKTLSKVRMIKLVVER